jgi:hypothetical protein
MMLDLEATAYNSALEAWLSCRPNRPLELWLERITAWICRYPQFAGMAA